jgi:hypothetical protein
MNRRRSFHGEPYRNAAYQNQNGLEYWNGSIQPYYPAQPEYNPYPHTYLQQPVENPFFYDSQQAQNPYMYQQQPAIPGANYPSNPPFPPHQMYHQANTFNPFENPLQPKPNQSVANGGANPYPKQAFMQKAKPTGVQSVLNQFKTQDGSIDLNKMVNTAGQMMNTVNQVSSLVKGVGSVFKA